MLRNCLAALGMTALLAACGGGDPPDSLTGVTLLNDASLATTLCPKGLEGYMTIGNEQFFFPNVELGSRVTLPYGASLINQIKKDKAIYVYVFCKQTQGTPVELRFTGTVVEDYKSKGGNYSLTINGTKASVGGYSNCVRPDAPNVLAPCVFGGAALGLPAPKRL